MILNMYIINIMFNDFISVEKKILECNKMFMV